MDKDTEPGFDLLTTKKSVGNLSLDKAVELIKFYEESASTVKSRTWTITTWILTLNVGLLAFAFRLYVDQGSEPEYLLLQLAISVVGVALSGFLVILIADQGQHLSHYWTMENKVGAWNGHVRGLVLDQQEFEKAQDDQYRAPMPRFCTRLRILALMFAFAFIGTFILFASLR